MQKKQFVRLPLAEAMESRMFLSASAIAPPGASLPAITRAVVASAATTLPTVTWAANARDRADSRTEPGVVQVGSKLYVLGGYAPASPGFLAVTHRCDVLDFTTGKYTRIADLPAGAPVNHAGVASDGKFIYLIAGQIEAGYGRGTNASFRYDIAANKWSRFVDLPQVRYGGGVAIVNNVLHYFGGDTSDRTTITTDHSALDLAHPEKGWIRKASLPLGGDHLGHAVINGMIYAIGGEHGHHIVGHNSASAPYIQHNYLFRYNPATDHWTRLADMPIASSHLEASTFLINGKIVLIGGVLNNDVPSNAIRYYDPATNKWTVLKSTTPYAVNGPVGGFWNGRIYLTNGFRTTPPPEGHPVTGWFGVVKGF